MKKMVFLDEASCNLGLQQPRPEEFPRQWDPKNQVDSANKRHGFQYPEVEAKSHSPGNIELGES